MEWMQAYLINSPMEGRVPSCSSGICKSAPIRGWHFHQMPRHPHANDACSCRSPYVYFSRDFKPPPSPTIADDIIKTSPSRSTISEAQTCKMLQRMLCMTGEQMPARRHFKGHSEDPTSDCVSALHQTNWYLACKKRTMIQDPVRALSEPRACELPFSLLFWASFLRSPKLQPYLQ